MASPIERSPSYQQATVPPPSGPSRSSLPSLLQPPATIVSPPSPVDTKHNQAAAFPSPPKVPDQPEQGGGRDDVVEYDSPEDEDETPSPPALRPRAVSDTLGRVPIAADQMSSSPSRSPSLLHPDSPVAIRPSSPRGSPIPRSPSPSSPHYLPRPNHHRRASSTHRVRETMDGETRHLSDGERMVNQYKVGKALGQGAYAKVELGVDVGTGKDYAIKEFSKSRLHLQALQQKQRSTRLSRGKERRANPGMYEDEQKDPSIGKPDQGEDGHGGPWKSGSMEEVENDPLGLVRREIAIMKKLDHPNIVQLYEAISVPNADSLFLVLEYMPGGVLMNVKMGQNADEVESPFSLDQSREYFRQLCLGLEYLHANEVVHRDIKPDNILLSADREVVKLCDFGVSEMFVAQGDDRIKKSGGSPAFLSPESFKAHVNDVHGKAVDIWALGVTLYCLLTGALPFNVSNPIELFDIVRKEDPPEHHEWDQDLQDLMKGMFQKKPSDRVVMATIRENSWVTAQGSEPMIPTHDNLYFIGKHVEEPTQEELRGAIGTLRSIFTVIRAVQKMRRLQLRRRSMSGQSPNISSHHSASPDTSTNPSLYSGSMDSYAASQPGMTDATSTDLDEKWKGMDFGSETMSPKSMRSEVDDDSPGGTERQDPVGRSTNPYEKLGQIKTKDEHGRDLPGIEQIPEEGDDFVVCASPTSD